MLLDVVSLFFRRVARSEEVSARRPIGWGLMVAGGMMLAACGPGPEDETYAPPGEVQEAPQEDGFALPPIGAPSVSPVESQDPAHAEPPVSVEESLTRLDALKLLEVGEVLTTQTQHMWIPYGGYWSPLEVELSEDEVAGRLASFVELVDEAAHVEEDLSAESDGLCFPAGGDSWCLTRTEHAADVAALNALEVVRVEGIVRDQTEVTGACYSSWDTVTEDDCRRAVQTRYLVEKTAHLPNSAPPEGPGE